MKGLNVATLLASVMSIAMLGACVDGEPESEGGDDEVVAETAQAVQSPEKRGKQLFKHETFDGNDRTCSTCHRGKTGDLSPADVEELFAEDPENPLFRSIDSDDGVGDSYTRLREDATIRIVRQLPPWLRPLDDLDATEIVVHRGVPSVNDSALKNILTADARVRELEPQAAGAIFDHFQPERAPTQQELSDIAAFERTLFSSKDLERYAEGTRPAPTLPKGNTAAQKRGKRHFEPSGACGLCHSGPMLNETSDFHPFGGGGRIEFALAGELEAQPNPLREWAILDEAGEIVEVFPFPIPDPGAGIALDAPFALGGFTIPPLWGASKTAPYFHDNSAKTIEEMVHHYAVFFEVQSFFGVTLSPQDEEDIVAYFKLL